MQLYSRTSTPAYYNFSFRQMGRNWQFLQASHFRPNNVSYNFEGMNVEPVVLEGKFVKLEPMKSEHVDALAAVGLEESLWKWIPEPRSTREDIEDYVTSALDDQARGMALPFVTIERSTGTVIGSTRFGNIDVANKRAEIGWTWINPT